VIDLDIQEKRLFATRLLPFKPIRRLREWVRAKWILPWRRRKDRIPLIAWAESRLNLSCRAEALGGVSNLTFRLRHAAGSHVVQRIYDQRHFAGTVALGEHLLRQGVPVPRILARCPQKSFLLLEDLGPVTVQSAIENSASPDDLLLRVARTLAGFHRLGTRDLERVDISLKSFSPDKWLSFNFNRLSWLRAFCPRISPGRLESLQQELRAFRARLRPEKGPHSLCHLDWSLSNLALKDSAIYILDWETASLCPPALELAKFFTYAPRIVWDAREKILAGYLEETALPSEEREYFYRQIHFFAIGYFLRKLPRFLYEGEKKRDFSLVAEILRDLFWREDMRPYPSLCGVMREINEFLTREKQADKPPFPVRTRGTTSNLKRKRL
jgi:aminoglycoside/choline kinase family phosphotransferase